MARMGHRWASAAAWVAVTAGAAVVGLAAVSAVRDAVADDPVQVLTAGDVSRILEEPQVSLAPLATVAPAESVPDVAVLRAPVRSQARRPGTNADDEDSPLEPGPVSAKGSRDASGATGRSGSTRSTGETGSTGGSGTVRSSGEEDPTMPTPQVTIPSPEPSGSSPAGATGATGATGPTGAIGVVEGPTDEASLGASTAAPEAATVPTASPGPSG